MTRPCALLMQSDPTRAWSCGRILTRHGYEVTACNDEADALGLISQHPYALYVSELWSSARGLAALRRACKTCGLPIVIADHNTQQFHQAQQLDRVVLLHRDHDDDLFWQLLDHCAQATEDHQPTAHPTVIEGLLHAVDSSGGELFVRSDGRVGRVFFVDHHIAWCITPGHGYLLDELRAVGIEQKKLKRVLTRCQADGTNFAEALIEDGLISRDAMRDILGRRIRRSLLDLLTWREPLSLFLPMQRRYSSSLTYRLEEILLAGVNGKQRYQMSQGSATR